MTYDEMKDIDLKSLSTKTEAKNKILEVIDSDINDILRYINYLRYKQFNSDDFVLMDKITKFLFFEEIASIERENSDEYDFGSVEELTFSTEIVSNEPNQIIIEDTKYICVAQFSDDFEKILILRNGSEYKKYGAIFKEDEAGIKYIYELPLESNTYFEELEKADIGIKANILSTIIRDKPSAKTFTKEKIDVDLYDFIVSKKIDKGVISNILGGTYLILKDEILLEPKMTFEEEQAQIEEERLKKEQEIEASKVSDNDDVSDDDVSDDVSDILNEINNQKEKNQDEEISINIEDEDFLKEQLQKAIENEDYNTAAQLKQQIDNL